MRKIPTLFKRDYDGDGLVCDEVAPGAEWVPAGEGAATRKWDGTACRWKDGKMWKRYSCREGKKMPPGFELEERTEQIDHRGQEVVKLYGWVPVGDDPADKWHRQALADSDFADHAPPDGATFELIGPKVQGNADRQASLRFARHGAEPLPDSPRDFAGLRAYLSRTPIEGIVWHHPDGRMAKIKAKDFGLPWPIPDEPKPAALRVKQNR